MENAILPWITDFVMSQRISYREIQIEDCMCLYCTIKATISWKEAGNKSGGEHGKR